MTLRPGWKNRWLHLGFVLGLGILLRFVNLSTVPLGYFHDEAWSGAKAYAILTGETAPQAYFPENNGMDAFHVYAIAALFALTGPLAMGSRIASATVGSLTILATYWAASELFAAETRRHPIALTAAFVYAMLFSALAVSRSGWHAISMALFSTLSVAALLRAQRLGRVRWYVLAGGLAGITQYTYPSARFLVVIVLIIALYDGWRHRAALRSIVLRYVVLIATAALVGAPLIVFFAQQPEWLFTRAQQTSRAADVGQNLMTTLLAFNVRGDIDNLHNLPGRPVLDPILSLFFAIGLIVCLVRRRVAYILLLLAIGVLTLPSLLTIPAALTRRWIGAMPFIAILAGLGVIVAYDWLNKRLMPPVRRSVVAFLVGLLIVSGGLTVLDYFGPYAANPQLFWAYDAGITQVANYVRDHPDETIFLTPYDRFYEVVALTQAEAGRAPLQSYNGLACAVFPLTTTRPTEWLVVTEKDRSTLPATRQLFPTNETVWRLNSPVGSYARALRVPAGQAAQFPLLGASQADFDGKVQLIGFDLPQRAQPGDSARFKIALQDVTPLDRLHKVFLHLRNSAGTIVAQDDHAPCSNSLNEADWRPGDVVVEPYQLTIPADAPPGTYRVVLGLYDADSGRRLPVRTATLPHDAEGVQIGFLQVK